MVPIAIDAMGGDSAPKAIIEGVGEALDSVPGLEKLLLVGAEDQIRRHVAEIGKADDERLEIVPADDAIGMDEAASASIRAKPRSSIAVAVDQVKAGRAGGIVSAGHTGAAVASTVLKLRTLPGIERPAIATVFPSPSGPFLILDAGANVDCKPRHLVQYAVMGEIYVREILGVEAPRIGLLNVGGEKGKGNELAKVTYEELAGVTGLNFAGNVEGRDLFSDHVDVVVCDGFVGNVVLKSCESMAGAFGAFLKSMLEKTVIRRAGALLAKNAFAEFRKLSDYAEYGGAPLLGVNGVCIIGHGSSSPRAIRNAIRVSAESIEDHLTDQIVSRVKELGVGTYKKKAAVPA